MKVKKRTLLLIACIVWSIIVVQLSRQKSKIFIMN